MVQPLGVCSTLSEGLGSIPIAHIRQLKATLQFQVLRPRLVSEGTLHMCGAQDMWAHTCAHKKKLEEKSCCIFGKHHYFILNIVQSGIGALSNVS